MSSTSTLSEQTTTGRFWRNFSSGLLAATLLVLLACGVLLSTLRLGPGRLAATREALTPGWGHARILSAALAVPDA